MPEVQVQLKDCVLIKALDFFVIQTLYEKEFLEWELYVMSYCSTIKKFRNLFIKCFSRSIFDKLSQQTISLDDSNQTRFYTENSKIYGFAFTNEKGINLYYNLS